MLLARGSIDGGCTARVAEGDAASSEFVAEWSALVADASEPNAFAEPWFMLPALAHLRGEDRVRLVEVRQGKRLIGLIPLALSRRYGRIPVHHMRNWTHYQCFMGTPLLRRGLEVDAWRAILALLDQSSWSSNFLTVAGLLEHGAVHRGLIAARGETQTVHRAERAALASDLDAANYLNANVRPKKRKELRRLAARLAEAGRVSFETLTDAKEVAPWCDTFLALEASGWKGQRGAAFANSAHGETFFRAVVEGAFAADRLDFQRLDLDGRAIAMLVNFRTPPGSWSFKIAYDEDHARFSPGVMIELENLKRVLDDAAVDWMDSCAIENHPMIDRLWGERRAIVQISVPLAGLRRRAVFAAVRAAERAAALARRASS